MIISLNNIILKMNELDEEITEDKRENFNNV